MHLELVDPTEEYEAEYDAMIAEILADGNTCGYSGYMLHDRGDSNFAQYVGKLRDEAAGLNLPEGRIPQTTFWLLENGKRLAGEIRLRHTLTPSLLQRGGNIGYIVRPSFRNRGCATFMVQQVLDRARKRGIDQVLITCDAENAASISVIQKCGGQLDEQKVTPDQDWLRFWIRLV
ncbi:MAG: GNAT family N-acetyltransferase [Candidatus Sumerlaeaceae bacterium]